MERTEEQARAERLFLRYCEIARLGGRIQLRKLLEAGFAAGYPKSIRVVRGLDNGTYPVAAAVSEAISLQQNFQIQEALAVFDDASFVPGPWLPAFEAILAWREIVKRSEECLPATTPTDEEHIREILAEIPTTYVGLELDMLLDELFEITKHFEWNQEALDSRRGVPNRSTIKYWIRLCASHTIKLVAEGMIHVPAYGWDWQPCDSRWYDVIRALIQRSDNLCTDSPDAP